MKIERWRKLRNRNKIIGAVLFVTLVLVSVGSVSAAIIRQETLQLTTAPCELISQMFRMSILNGICEDLNVVPILARLSEFLYPEFSFIRVKNRIIQEVCR
jgi:uncharacterized protein YybS (DUF2232 family)